MNKSIPKVSVVMSVYNGAHYLQKSVDSILGQTFTDFEFIIIDDGSTDDTWQMLLEYANRDPRLKPFQNAENLGLTKTLNRGLKLARGEYIARLDADDRSFPERLEQQVTYLQSHPSVALVSTGVQYVDPEGRELRIDIPPTNLTVLRWEFLFRNPLRHPTVMWRRELVQDKVGYYDPNFVCTQDYDFWVRISETSNIATIPSVLVQMSWHNQSISSKKAEMQDALGTKVIYRQIKRYFPDEKLGEKDIANLRLMSRRKDALQLEYFDNLDASSFQQASNLYLLLWKRFCAIENIKEKDLAWQAIRQEVEQNVVELLGHCKVKRWFFSGSKLLKKYLSYCPERTFALLSIILKRLIPKKVF